MSKLIRSPVNRNVQHTLSDSDIAQTKTHETATQRSSKRRRGSPDKSCTTEDIKNILAEWKNNENSLLNKLVNDVAEIKHQNTQIKESNKEIEKALEFLNCQYEAMRKKMELLESERKEHISQIEILEQKVEELNRTLKSSSIEIRNMSSMKNYENKDELSSIVVKTCKALNVDIEKRELKDIYVIRGKGGNNTIVAEFTSNIVKHNVIKGVKLYNKQHPNSRLNTSVIGLDGDKKRIYISEALTYKARRLFYLARDLAKTEEFKYCWVSNGKIFLRKTDQSQHMEIKNEFQLISLRSKK
ncbi:unnamed protein product [Leptidea sinapis]|uniref:FP protein C-terminal domain-containing protein n=1 Tax=Leptidea sinapis TaxID=189913 RepID=A0A5E4QF19_9NEOP|nr:unnamed protein product [Leptidea sinapis]